MAPGESEALGEGVSLHTYVPLALGFTLGVGVDVVDAGGVPVMLGVAVRLLDSATAVPLLLGLPDRESEGDRDGVGGINCGGRAGGVVGILMTVMKTLIARVNFSAAALAMPY